MVSSEPPLIVRIERITVETIKSAHPLSVYNTRLPLGIINVLPQPRETFWEIDVLGDNIALNNLQALLRVARYDAKHCQEYLNENNELWPERFFRLEDLFWVQENGQRIFYILLDGGRRYRSCIYLRDVGCSDYRKRFGPGGCYERHFGDLSVDIRVSDNIPPDEAIDIQASANIHHRLPLYEEARFYNRLLRNRKRKNPRYAIAELARRVGRTPDAISQAIRFCDLPLSCQKYVEKGEIRWGIGIELTRLQIQIGLDEKELENWIIKAITENLKVPEFRERVSKFLFNLKYDQMSLFSPAEERFMRMSAIRIVVERHTIMAIHSFILYLNRVFDLFLAGKLGKKDSPFSHRSPVKVYRKLIDLMEKVLTQLIIWHLLPEKECERAQQIIQQTKEALSYVEERLPGKEPK